MRILRAILEGLGILPVSQQIGRQRKIFAIRELLGNRCPLCGGSLAGHSYGVFASIRLGRADLMERAATRNRIFEERLDHLPVDGANDPASDLVWYALLECPIIRDNVVVEHFSGSDIFSEESFEVLFDVARDRRDKLRVQIYDRLLL